MCAYKCVWGWKLGKWIDTHLHSCVHTFGQTQPHAGNPQSSYNPTNILILDVFLTLTAHTQPWLPVEKESIRNHPLIVGKGLAFPIYIDQFWFYKSNIFQVTIIAPLKCDLHSLLYYTRFSAVLMKLAQHKLYWSLLCKEVRGHVFETKIC